MATQSNPAINQPENNLTLVVSSTSQNTPKQNKVKNAELSILLRDEDTPPKSRFMLWLSTPASERVPQTQKQLAKILDVSNVTLSKWKAEPGFSHEVLADVRRRELAFASGVLEKLRERALDGDLKAIELYATLILEFGDNHSPSVTINNNQLTAMIGGSPAEQLPFGLVNVMPKVTPKDQEKLEASEAA